MKYPGKGATKEQWRKYFAAIRPLRGGAGKKRTRKRGAKKNPAPARSARPRLYIITAKGTGPKMHYDGKKFSQRARVKTFPSKESAYGKALQLVSNFSVLKNYDIKVEPNSFR